MSRDSGVVAVVIGVLTATIPTFFLFQAVTFLLVVPLVLGIVCILLGIIALRTESKLLRHVGWIATIIMLIAIIVPCGLIAYDRRSGYPIVMVIAEGYRGPVRLIIDKERGIDVPVKEGKYSYHIPQSGIVLIKDPGPFRQWHSTTPIYADGKPIPIEDDRTLPDAVAFRFLGSGVVMRDGKKIEEYLEDFVGTKAELRKYVDSR